MKTFFLKYREVRLFNEEKQLLNNLQSSLPDGKAKKDLNFQALEQVGIDPTRRGETLSVEEFAKLSNALYEDFSSMLQYMTK